MSNNWRLVFWRFGPQSHADESEDVFRLSSLVRWKFQEVAYVCLSKSRSRCLISIIKSCYSPELPLSCGVGHWEQSDRHLSFFATFNIRGTLREPDLCPGATGKCNGTFVNDKVHASKKLIITTIIKGSLSIFVKNRCWQAWGAAKWRSPSIFDWIDLTTGKGKAYHVIAWACPWTSHKSNWSLSSNIKVPIIERTFS